MIPLKKLNNSSITHLVYTGNMIIDWNLNIELNIYITLATMEIAYRLPYEFTLTGTAHIKIAVDLCLMRYQ